MNGPYKHPGALFVRYKAHNSKSDQSAKEPDVVKKFLASLKVRESVAKTLRVGDIVDRHLIDGDIVLFNRQPSLHRVSMQAFKVCRINTFTSLIICFPVLIILLYCMN